MRSTLPTPEAALLGLQTDVQREQIEAQDVREVVLLRLAEPEPGDATHAEGAGDLLELVREIDADRERGRRYDKRCRPEPGPPVGRVPRSCPLEERNDQTADQNPDLEQHPRLPAEPTAQVVDVGLALPVGLPEKLGGLPADHLLAPAELLSGEVDRPECHQHDPRPEPRLGQVAAPGAGEDTRPDGGREDEDRRPLDRSFFPVEPAEVKLGGQHPRRQDHDQHHRRQPQPEPPRQFIPPLHALPRRLGPIQQRYQNRHTLREKEIESAT